MFAPTEELASEGAPDWMVSYADMITILMSFFAVMFSMAMSKDAKKDAPMIKSLHRQFGAQADGRNNGPMPDYVHTDTGEFGDQATIGGMIYFDLGKSALAKEQLQQLESLAKVLGSRPGKIEILARTFGQPQDADDTLSSNWSLAQTRCSNTTRCLVSSGIDPQRIRIGVAARFEPIRVDDDAHAPLDSDSIEVFTLNQFTEGARVAPIGNSRD